GKRRGFAGRSAPRDEVNREVADDWRQHRQQRWHDHFLDRRLCKHIDGTAVIRLVLALHNAGLGAELPAHFLDDCAGRAADGGHAERAKQVWQQTTEQEADYHIRAVEREIELDTLEVWVLPSSEESQVLVIGGEQHQRAEAG